MLQTLQLKNEEELTMFTSYILTFVLLFAVLVCIVVALTYTIYRDTNKIEHNFQLQLAAAQAKQRPEIHKLEYSELIKIVNEVINYFTSQNMDVLSLASKTEEEISVILDELTADIATKVKVNISPMISDCITCYVTEDFYDRYILNSTRLMIVANIEKQKRMAKREKHTPKPENKLKNDK